MDSLTLVQSLAELQRDSRKIVARWGHEFDYWSRRRCRSSRLSPGRCSQTCTPTRTAPSLTVVAMVAFTAVYNITGQPAMSLPLHWSDRRAPDRRAARGRSLAGALLLQVAAQLEEAAPWAGRRPPTA